MISLVGRVNVRFKVTEIIGTDSGGTVENPILKLAC